MKKFKLKKGDNVTVISGKDKGKTGEIIEVFKSIDKVVDVEILDDGCIVQKTKCGTCANAPVVKDICSQQK